jgi:hypothetical protein
MAVATSSSASVAECKRLAQCGAGGKRFLRRDKYPFPDQGLLLDHSRRLNDGIMREVIHASSASTSFV